jgi:hypothetical protein
VVATPFYTNQSQNSFFLLKFFPNSNQNHASIAKQTNKGREETKSKQHTHEKACLLIEENYLIERDVFFASHLLLSPPLIVHIGALRRREQHKRNEMRKKIQKMDTHAAQEEREREERNR